MAHFLWRYRATSRACVGICRGLLGSCSGMRDVEGNNLLETPVLKLCWRSRGDSPHKLSSSLSHGQVKALEDPWIGCGLVSQKTRLALTTVMTFVVACFDLCSLPGGIGRRRRFRGARLLSCEFKSRGGHCKYIAWISISRQLNNSSLGTNRYFCACTQGWFRQDLRSTSTKSHVLLQSLCSLAAQSAV